MSYAATAIDQTITRTENMSVQLGPGEKQIIQSLACLPPQIDRRSRPLKDRIELDSLRQHLNLGPPPMSEFLGPQRWIAGSTPTLWLYGSLPGQNERRADLDFFFSSCDALNRTAVNTAVPRS